MKGQVISGEYGKIIIRQKSNQSLELGELLIADNVLLQVYDLIYGSQISQQNLELISGMKLEQDTDLEFLDPELRNYTLALLKPLIHLRDNNASLCKVLPPFFSEVRDVTNQDLSFLTVPKNPLYIGNLRSGSKLLDIPISLEGDKVFAHHILIPASTGRGKSNLCSVMLWDIVDKDYCGVLVLDPHDEYYGRNKLGLKDHPQKDKVVYYTHKNPPVGQRTLKINLKLLRPSHFHGALDLSPPQKDALSLYYRHYGRDWIESIILEKPIDINFHESTLAVVKRKLLNLLCLEFANNQLFSNGVFDLNAGLTTISDIIKDLEDSKTVIVDTSNFSGASEILIGSIIANELLNRYKNYKITGELNYNPVISIVLEEAPRVLGKEVLENGPNIFSTIAREGRKFKIGLTAITQLPSLIPRQILANMNTKIILGIEMAPERQAIIESSAQDLSTDSRNIASLDKGEAIITSNFARFATPVKIPLFTEYVKKYLQKSTQSKLSFQGVDLV
ncbi:ATP-binding protein [Candidatus Woesearchaeota archaeon]|nr:ATP-binding protein [Candidatus Woesearchaeota archaeon]